MSIEKNVIPYALNIFSQCEKIFTWLIFRRDGLKMKIKKSGTSTGRIPGSFNWTAQAEKRNAENLLVITDTELIKKYQKRFEHLWGKGRS
jgi:hypothetical protein